jgi:large subunit ribosomal protein L6
MSRIGKNPVEVPSGVEVSIVNDLLTAKGKISTQTVRLHESVDVKQEGGKVVVNPREGVAAAHKMWGTMRSMINNAVVGASEGFIVRLEINGVGYRAAVQGNILNLQLGYSHDIQYPVPEGVAVKCDRPTLIEISGGNKQQVGQVASEIRAFRKPEPYKGKGVKYENELIVRKEGKKK